MEPVIDRLQSLFDRIPRRHTADNVKDIQSLIDEYEDILMEMEADAEHGAAIAAFFEPLEDIRAIVKKSNSPKASKKEKDQLFDQASGNLKDTMQELMDRVRS